MPLNKKLRVPTRGKSLSPIRNRHPSEESDSDSDEAPAQSSSSVSSSTRKFAHFGVRQPKVRPGRTGRSEFQSRQMQDTPILEDEDEEGSYEIIPKLPSFGHKKPQGYAFESERKILGADDTETIEGRPARLSAEEDRRRRIELELDDEVDHTFNSLNANTELFGNEDELRGPANDADEPFSSSDDSDDSIELARPTQTEDSQRRSSQESDSNGKRTFKDVLRDRLNLIRTSTGDSAPGPIRRRASTMQTVDSGKSEHFLSRVLNLGNLTAGGLAPGAARAEPSRLEDEEGRIYDTDIPLDDMDPEQLNDEAKHIVQQHAFNSSTNSTLVPNNVSPPRQEDQQPEVSEEGPSVRLEGNHLYAPNPDLYMRGYDLNYDNAPNDDDYVPPPEKVSAGVLSSLLTLYKNPAMGKSFSRLSDSDVFTPRSGAQTPTSEQFDHNSNIDQQSLMDRLRRVNSSSSFTRPGLERSRSETDVNKKHRGHRRAFSSQTFNEVSNTIGDYTHSLFPGKKHADGNEGKIEAEKLNMPRFATVRPKDNRSKAVKKKLVKKRLEAQARITVHIADVLQRQRFILKLCKTLMLYGAPTHRLEEYMTMTARVLEIDGQFIYFPGCMIVSFGDPATRTSEMQLVRCAQGLDLGKLDDAHKIYKDVVHDVVGVEEAAEQIEALLKKPPLYNAYLCVLIYGFSSAMVTPWGFKGTWVDMPVSFGIGCLVGILQFIVAPRSNLYSSVFEVSASIVVSFLGRALGSIGSKETVCFSAVVQGSLALILPGYIILCGSLELQSRNLVAGAVRMFYAIIYSLFLGFGITLGAALYGWIDHNATSETVCSKHQISPWYRFLLVPMFAVGLGLVNQARWQQLPSMVCIAGGGYVVTYFSSLHFSSSTEFTSAIGAFVVGLLANLYSRIRKGVAVTAMLPGIFVQVPSGIASQGSLLSGISTANEIVNSTTSSTTSSTTTTSSSTLSFGIVMIQVSIGISVGLFAATIAVYPLGKKRTGLFTL